MKQFFRYRGRKVQLVAAYDWRQVRRILDGDKVRLVEAKELAPYISPEQRKVERDKLRAERLAELESRILVALQKSPYVTYVAIFLGVCWNTAKKYVVALEKAGKVRRENGKTLPV